MPLTFTDEFLKDAGLTERDILIEFACMVYEMGRLSLPAAAQCAHLSPAEFEQELRKSQAARTTARQGKKPAHQERGHGTDDQR
jgi:predicted HTH domain antitoxin